MFLHLFFVGGGGAMHHVSKLSRHSSKVDKPLIRAS